MLGNYKTRVPMSHLSLSLIKKEESNQKDEKDAPDTGTPQLQKNLGALDISQTSLRSHIPRLKLIIAGVLGFSQTIKVGNSSLLMTFPSLADIHTTIKNPQGVRH